MTFISLNEINSNPIYQPPSEWINNIEKEEQLIKDNFYSNNFDVWEIIKIKKKNWKIMKRLKNIMNGLIK